MGPMPSLDDLPTAPCHLNGRLVPLNEATVSVLDRGFIFGDGIYEVVPVYARRPFRLEQHLARLHRNLSTLRITNPHGEARWAAIVGELVDAQELDDVLVYVQVTRGVALRDHVMPQGIEPTVFAMVMPMRQPSAEVRAAGVACVSAADLRWQHADIKCTSLLGNVLARQISADAGAVETVMFRDGWLTEASSSNVWVVDGATVVGPPAGPHLLDGVRVGLIEELCAATGIGFTRRPIAEAEVRGATEVLLSSATKEVLAVTTLDGEPVGSGRPGPVGRVLYAAYQEVKAGNR